MMIIKKMLKNIFIPEYNSVYLCRLVLKYHKKNKTISSNLLRNRILYKYGIHIGLGCSIGTNLNFPHPQGIIIGNAVTIGSDCTIYHQVTLGKKNGNLDQKQDYPTVGDNVTIFAGAKIIGNIHIGNNAIIAPNSVVVCDVEENATYAGIPAKRIK